MNRHGLVIGKFYPPHRGHHELIDAALDRAERVSVVVMASGAETIPLADRVEWLRMEHPAAVVIGIPCDAPMDVDDNEVWVAQIALMRAALRTVSSEPVDMVLTGGDTYGPELARRLDASLAVVMRPAGGSSGTSVRANLAEEWSALRPTVRAGLATRVVFVGAESTGTTTISKAIAEHYRVRWPETRWVPEFGRDYTEIKWDALGRAMPLDAMTWDQADFDMVGMEQTRREEEAARAGSPIVVCDTDALATAMWERRYLGPDARSRPAYADALPRRDLYLITDHVGVPWEDDGMREGDLGIRAAMTGWFEDVLTERGLSWVLLTGSEEKRVSMAIRSIEPVLARRMRFGAPLTGPGFGG